MLYNGLRRSEVVSLNIGSIFPNENGELLLKVIGKGGKERIRPLYKDTKIILYKYLKMENRLDAKENEPLIVCCGKRISDSAVYKIVKRTCKKLGREDIHPHSFRAKFASMALESGAPITSVQEDMGHSSIETTAIYDKSKKSFERLSVIRINLITSVSDIVEREDFKNGLQK